MSYEFETKIGTNENVGTGNFVLLSPIVEVTPSIEGAKVVSTSANDSSLGIGVQKVKLVYLDNNWTKNTEIITLNGTTPVPTSANNIQRVESFEVFSTNNGWLGAAGTISLTNIAGTNLFAQIDPGGNVYERAFHYVPPGYISYITDIICCCPTAGGAKFEILSIQDNISEGGSLVYQPLLEIVLVNRIANITFQEPLIVWSNRSGGIGIFVKGLDANQMAHGSFKYKDFQF